MKPNMHLSSETIDQIVRNVMRDMQSRKPATSFAVPVTRQLTDDLTSVVRIDSKVITEEVLVKANAAGRAVALSPAAVMTPSARDFIRRNAVRLASRVHGSAAATSRLVIGIGADSMAVSAAGAAGWRSLMTATEIEAATIAAQHEFPGIVICGGEPSVVACLLNRNPEMRAAVITRSTDLVTLTTVMNPQVVCLESSGWSFGELLRLLRSLATSTAAPASWNELSAGGVR